MPEQQSIDTNKTYNLVQFLSDYRLANPNYKTMGNAQLVETLFTLEPALRQLNWDTTIRKTDLPKIPSIALKENVDSEGRYTGYKPGLLSQFGYSTKALLPNFLAYVTNMATALAIDPGGSGKQVRKEANDWLQSKIRDLQDDPEVQALIRWNEEEPVRFSGENKNWYHGDILIRGFLEAAPSLVAMAIAGLATGGSFAAVALTAGIMEASANNVDTYQQGLDAGLSDEDANNAAMFSSMLYGALSGIEEATSFHWFLRTTGLMSAGKKAMKKSIMKSLLGEVKKVGGWKTFAKTAGIKTVGGLSSSLAEGLQEYIQYMTEQIVQQGTLNKFGDNPDDVMANLTQTVIDSYWDEEAQRSFHSGISAGLGIGMPGSAIGTPRAFGRENRKARLIKDINEGLKNANLHLDDKKAIAEKVYEILQNKGNADDIIGAYSVIKDKEKGKDIEKVGVPKAEKKAISIGEKFLQIAINNPEQFVDALSEIEDKEVIFQDISKALKEKGFRNSVTNIKELGDAVKSIESAEFLAQRFKDIPPEEFPEFSREVPPTEQVPIVEEFAGDISEGNAIDMAKTNSLDFLTDEAPDIQPKTLDFNIPSEATDADLDAMEAQEQANVSASIASTFGASPIKEPVETEGTAPVPDFDVSPSDIANILTPEQLDTFDKKKAEQKSAPVEEKADEKVFFRGINEGELLEDISSKRMAPGSEVPRISSTEGVDVMRGSKWGNPFVVPDVYDKSPAYYKKKGFIRAKSREDAIQSYEDWIRGTAHEGFLPEKRASIIAGLKSGELKGKTLKYFKPDAEDSHAIRLAKLVAAKAPAEVEKGMTQEQAILIEEAVQVHRLYLNRGSETSLTLEVGVDEGIINAEQSKLIFDKINLLERHGKLGQVGEELKFDIISGIGDFGVPKQKTSTRKKSVVKQIKQPKSEKVITRKTVKESLSNTLQESGNRGLTERLGKASATDLNKLIKMYNVSDQFVVSKSGNIVLTKNGGKKAVATKLASIISERGTVKAPTKSSMEVKIQKAQKSVGSITQRKVDFQKISESDQPLIIEKPEVAREIEERLARHYPQIKPVKVTGLIKEHGVTAVGKAIGNVATWSKNKGGIDVAPHEYAHIYIDMFEDSNIVKQGILNFNGKEGLVKHIGNYYAGRIQDKTLLQKTKRWLKNFWTKVKFVLGSKKAVNDIIAEKFFQGKEFKVTEPKQFISTADNGTWYSKTEEVDEDNVEVDLTPRGSKGSTQTVENYFSHIFNSYVSPEQHAEMVDLAVNHKSYGSFRPAFIKFIRDTFPDPIFAETSMQFDNRAKQFFNKSRSIIKTATSLDEPGRLYLNLIFQAVGFNSVGGVPEFKVNNGIDLVTGRKMPERHNMNFVEHDGKTTVFHLGMKQIVKYRTNGNFYRPANIDLTPSIVREIDENFVNGHKEGESLLFFLGAKGGDSSQLLISGVPANVMKMSKDNIIKALKTEIGKTIEQSDYDNFMLDGMILTGEAETGEGKTERKVSNLVWNQIYGKHEVMKKIKGNDYLMREKNVTDTYNRFRIDFAEGYVAVGSGPDQLMIVDMNEVEVKVRDGNLLQPSIDYTEYDGWKIVGSERMDVIQDAGGRNPESEDGTDLKALKTVQRYLSKDGNDYIGEKMMDMTPFPGMEFYKKGESMPFARVVENENGLTYFEQLNENGKVIDQFYSMVSTNEAKQISGKFTKENDGFYKVHEIPEESTRILITPAEKAKNDPAHPLAWWEQLWSPSVNKEKFDSVINAIKRHIDTVSKKYMTSLLDAERNPKTLRQLLWRPPTEGRLPTELQQVLDLLENGVGLTHGKYLSQIMPQLRNSFIIDGLFKLRQKGMGTKLHLKPRVHLNVQEKEFMVSVDNIVMVDLVLKKMNKTREDGWDIDSLNRWLKNNVMEVLLSKPPIEKASAVGVYTLKEFVPRGHGDVIFLNEKDVKGPLKADADGDTAQIEVYENKGLINAIKAFINDEEFTQRDRNIFTELELYPDVVGGTSSSSREDVANTIANMSFIDGALAKAVIAKMVSNKMAMKELSFKIYDKTYTPKNPNEPTVLAVGLDKNKVTPEIFEELYSEGDYFILKDGTKIETYKEYQESEKAYSVTTYENSLSVYMQMAADPKFGLLQKAGFNENFFIKRMFYEDGKKITSNNPQLFEKLSAVEMGFNDSSIKNGRIFGREATFQELFVRSQEINSILSLPIEEQGEAILADIKRNNKKAGKITNLKVNGKVGVTEYLLTQLNKHIERRNKRLNTALSELLPVPEDKYGNLIESKEAKKKRIRLEILNATRSSVVPFVNRMPSIEKMAHKNTIMKIIKNMSDKGIIVGKKNISGFSQTEIDNAQGFANSMGREFFTLNAELTRFKKEDNKFINYDNNKEFKEFIAKHYIPFTKLSKKEQELSTLFFLVGIIKEGEFFRIQDVVSLPPIELMDKNILKNYLQMRENEKLSNLTKVTKQEYTTVVNTLFNNIGKYCL